MLRVASLRRGTAVHRRLARGQAAQVPREPQWVGLHSTALLDWTAFAHTERTVYLSVNQPTLHLRRAGDRRPAVLVPWGARVGRLHILATDRLGGAPRTTETHECTHTHPHTNTPTPTRTHAHTHCALHVACCMLHAASCIRASQDPELGVELYYRDGAECSPNVYRQIRWGPSPPYSLRVLRCYCRRTPVGRQLQPQAHAQTMDWFGPGRYQFFCDPDIDQALSKFDVIEFKGSCRQPSTTRAQAAEGTVADERDLVLLRQVLGHLAHQVRVPHEAHRCGLGDPPLCPAAAAHTRTHTHAHTHAHAHAHRAASRRPSETAAADLPYTHASLCRGACPAWTAVLQQQHTPLSRVKEQREAL